MCSDFSRLQKYVSANLAQRKNWITWFIQHFKIHSPSSPFINDTTQQREYSWYCCTSAQRTFSHFPWK